MGKFPSGTCEARSTVRIDARPHSLASRRRSRQGLSSPETALPQFRSRASRRTCGTDGLPRLDLAPGRRCQCRRTTGNLAGIVAHRSMSLVQHARARVDGRWPVLPVDSAGLRLPVSVHWSSKPGQAKEIGGRALGRRLSARNDDLLASTASRALAIAGVLVVWTWFGCWSRP